MFNPERLTIVSDGQRLAFVVLDGLVYLAPSYCVKQMSTTIHQGMIDVTNLDGYRKAIPGYAQTTLTLEIVLNEGLITGDKDLLKGLRPIDSLSIEGLFKVIQERIKER